MPAASFRTYLVPVLLSLGLVVLSPLGLLIVLLSGDSCCGQNTTGTMVGVTAVLVAALTALGGGLALALRNRARRPAYRVRVGWAIIAGPTVLIHVLFVAVVSITAF